MKQSYSLNRTCLVGNYGSARYIVSVINGEVLVLVGVLIVEMATVFLGLFSWKNRLREKKD